MSLPAARQPSLSLPAADADAVAPQAVQAHADPAEASDRNRDPAVAAAGPPLLPPPKDTLGVPYHDPLHRHSLSSMRSYASSPRRSRSPYAAAAAAANASWLRRWLLRLWSSLYTSRGLLLILLSQFFSSLMALTTRVLETAFPDQKFHAMQILFARQSITMVGSLLWMWLNHVPDAPFGPHGVRWLLVARGFGGFWGVFGLYYSLTYLDLSDATVITFLAPIVASYACSIIPTLREPFTRTEVFAGLTSLVGVFLIARPASIFDFGRSGGDPGYNETLTPEVSMRRRNIFPSTGEKLRVSPQQRFIAIAVALVGVLGAATAYTTIRWIGARAHPLVSVNYFATGCTIVSLVSLVSVPSVGGIVWPGSLLQWALLTAIGTGGFIGQFLLTRGLQLETAGRGTNMVYSQLLFALFWQRVVWGATPNVLSVIGSALILTAVLCVGLKKRPQEEKPNELGPIHHDEERGLVAGRDSEEDLDNLDDDADAAWGEEWRVADADSNAEDDRTLLQHSYKRTE